MGNDIFQFILEMFRISSKIALLLSSERARLMVITIAISKNIMRGAVMIRVAIVEDEAFYAETIRDYIFKYSNENDEQFEVSLFSDGDGITKDFRPIFDIIFLDVQMKFMDGMATAEYIRKLDKDVILIFITNMAQYAIRGYAVDALSYLLKPVPYFAFSQELKRSLERLRNLNKSFLMIPSKNGVMKLTVRNILYVESYKHSLIVHTDNEEYSFVGTMKDMEKKLSDKHFYRCNNGYLLNLAQVTGVKDNFALVGKHRLQISRPRKKSFLNALTDYVGGLVK